MAQSFEQLLKEIAGTTTHHSSIADPTRSPCGKSRSTGGQASASASMSETTEKKYVDEIVAIGEGCKNQVNNLRKSKAKAAAAAIIAPGATAPTSAASETPMNPSLAAAMKKLKKVSAPVDPTAEDVAADDPEEVEEADQATEKGVKGESWAIPKERMPERRCLDQDCGPPMKANSVFQDNMDYFVLSQVLGLPLPDVTPETAGIPFNNLREVIAEGQQQGLTAGFNTILYTIS